MKNTIGLLLIFTIIMLFGCKNNSEIRHISFDLNQNAVYLDDKKINEYDYVWHIDPKGDYNEVKDSPGEYFTGEKPDETDGIWIAHDIRYFPMIDKSKFVSSELSRNPERDPEWNTYYQNEKYKDLLFASLPGSYDGNQFPAHMMHTEVDAYNNPCFHITIPGTYELTGTWHGQIFVDLGKDSITDKNKKITLILNNLELFCDVGPAINISRAYECDNAWEDRTFSTDDIDLNDTGVNIILKDDSKNYISGANVYRIYKNVLKKNGVEQKKAIKYDGAIESDISFSINGEKKKNGEMHVDAKLEGISSSLHLVINGGIIYVNADDDGINCSETGVSILKINGGVILANAGLGYQGDGLDSNGYTLINGGEIIAIGDYKQDPGMDSVKGTRVSGGSFVALGQTANPDWTEVYMKDNIDQSYIFKSYDKVIDGDSKMIVVDENGNEVYTFYQRNIPYLNSEPRDYNAILISNPKIKKDKKYDVIIRP